MSRLFIAEKPSLGRAIADVLPRPHKKTEGAIHCGNGDIVTWCVGHLLEQVEPDAYDARYKKWCLEDLPIVPTQWQLRPKKTVSKQLTIVRKLLKNAKQIVHAGDPDREGQLLVDEVIDYCGVGAMRRAQVQRLLINDLNPSAVTRALHQLRDNRDFMPLSISALARSRADWLYGMNMSRAYTLLGKQSGYQGVLSVGRVQTPVLGMVVKRDETIENFVPQDYFTLHALIPYTPAHGELPYDIKARWQPSEACQPWQDEEGRVLHRPLVDNVAKRIQGQPATVKTSEQKQTKQAPPLPYALSALQIDAAKRHNMSAKQVLDVCQSLYEKHKLITYPRSDCRYLPQSHLQEAGVIMKSISRISEALATSAKNADLTLRSKAWNDKKVEAHHAIIPTPKQPNPAQLSSHEVNVYTLIVQQYLMQFYPPAVYAESKLVFEIAGGKFIASGRQLLSPGWLVIRQKPSHEKATEASTDGVMHVPPLPEGMTLTCREGLMGEHQTEPPKPFTEATLLQAMTGIARFVDDQSLKKILRETDGLGTEATRAGIIDILMKRQLLQREGKQIRSTAAGRGLIRALPLHASTPDMTAHWEHQLQDMAEKKQAYQPFMTALTEQLESLMIQIKQSPLSPALADLPQPKRTRQSHRPYRSKKK